MNRHIIIHVLLSLAGVALSGTSLWAASQITSTPERYLIRFKETVQEETAQEVLLQYGLKYVRTIPEIGVQIADPEEPKSFARTTLRKLRKDERVLYAERNGLYFASELPERTPNDPQYSSQAEYKRLAIEAAWDRQTGSRDVVVAITDTGMDLDHVDLKNQLWSNPKEIPGNGIDDDGNGFIDDVHGWNFVSKSNVPDDDNRHGTHVAGIIGAEGDNSVGTAGVNWRVTLMPLKFLDGNGSGTTENGVDAVLYAAKNGAQVINASWGGGGFSQALQDAIQYARDHGALFVAAAGNDASDNDAKATYPANYANVLSVASSQGEGSLSSFSNFGATTVGVAAPGSNIFSSLPNDQWGRLSGTSMATPMISGLAALILATQPGLAPTVLRNAILNAVDHRTLYDGRLMTDGDANAARALSQLDQGFQIWPARVRLKTGAEFEFTAYRASGNVSWKTSDSSLATIDAKGKLKARKAGTVRVEARDSTGALVSTGDVILVQGTNPPSTPGCDWLPPLPKQPDALEVPTQALNFSLPVVVGLIARRRWRKKNQSG